MENQKKKTLQINCSVCDARNLQESALEQYERVKINAAALIVTPRSRELLSRFSVACNAANVVTAPEGDDAAFCGINGKQELYPGAAPVKPTFLMVNGMLTIHAGAGDTLAGYQSIIVNGNVLCPESLGGMLGNLTVNGKLVFYPDDCILLPNTLQLDRTFVLRARQGGRYFAASRVVALAPDIGIEKLIEKDISFFTRQVLVAESMAEAAMPLFNERANVTILPDGCAYVDDDAVLNGSLLRRYGGKLFINGDLTVEKGAGEALPQIEYLKVNGDVEVPKALEEAFCALNAEYDELIVTGGNVVRDLPVVNVDRSMLEMAEDGLLITDCAVVNFLNDVPPELIRERLNSIADCACVNCSEEQLGAVQLAATDIAAFNGKPELNGGEETEEERVVINVADYRF